MYKTRFSGFYQTDLDTTLKRLAIKYLIVTGCTTSICVESTVRDAMFRDYLPQDKGRFLSGSLTTRDQRGRSK